MAGTACAGEESAPAGSGAIAVEDLRQELAKASCEFGVRCGFMPSQQVCVDVADVGRETLQLLADVVFDRVTYDPAAARACVDARRAQSCEALGSTYKQVEEACKSVFKGVVPTGGVCLVSQECAGGGVCDVTMCSGEGACCAGVCAPKPEPVALGGDCSMEACVEEAYCDAKDDGMGTISGTCAARAKSGKPCTSADACEDGLRCDLGGDENCYVLAKEGQQCNPGLKNGACLRVDNWCHATERMCVRLPAPGEPCTTDGRCLGYAFCDSSMTCKSRPIEGEGCTPDSGAQCLGSLSCEMDDKLMKSICKQPASSAVCVLGGNGPPPM